MEFNGDKMKLASKETLEKLLKINPDKASEIMRCITWDLVPDALGKADAEMGDFGIAYLKKAKKSQDERTRNLTMDSYSAIYVDKISAIHPTLLYDVQEAKFYVTPLKLWMNVKGYTVD